VKKRETEGVDISIVQVSHSNNLTDKQ